MLVAYDMFFVDIKPIATVDVKAITDEFMKLATKSNLNEAQMNELAAVFSESLSDGIVTMSNDNILLAKRAVVSNEQDRTGELRDYVASKITKRDAH
jgi:hypothetical protein